MEVPFSAATILLGVVDMTIVLTNKNVKFDNDVSKHICSFRFTFEFTVMDYYIGNIRGV